LGWGPFAVAASDSVRPTLPDWSAVNSGDSIPPLALPPLTRHTLALYCGASGDHNPIHVDIDFAHSAGLRDVIAHGMLSAAWVGRLLTNWVPQAALRALDVRFSAMTEVAERITATGRIVEKFVDEEGRRCARLTLATASEQGSTKLGGEALVVWPAG
jgi:acyl dehydratase